MKSGGIPHPSAECPPVDPTTGAALQPNPMGNVQVLRNFMHHNEAWGGGYGTALSKGANATIGGNTFLMNRHAIADDGASLSGYVAWNNLVLSSVPTWYDPPDWAFVGRRTESRKETTPTISLEQWPDVSSVKTPSNLNRQGDLGRPEAFSGRPARTVL